MPQNLAAELVQNQLLLDRFLTIQVFPCQMTRGNHAHAPVKPVKLTELRIHEAGIAQVRFSCACFV
jgi:hypothetical protein